MQRQVRTVQVIQKTFEIPQVQFIDGVVHVPVVTQWQMFMVQKCRSPWRDHRSNYVDRIVDVPVVRQRQVPTIPFAMRDRSMDEELAHEQFQGCHLSPSWSVSCQSEAIGGDRNRHDAELERVCGAAREGSFRCRGNHGRSPATCSAEGSVEVLECIEHVDEYRRAAIGLRLRAHRCR